MRSSIAAPAQAPACAVAWAIGFNIHAKIADSSLHDEHAKASASHFLDGAGNAGAIRATEPGAQADSAGHTTAGRPALQACDVLQTDSTAGSQGNARSKKAGYCGSEAQKRALTVISGVSSFRRSLTKFGEDLVARREDARSSASEALTSIDQRLGLSDMAERAKSEISSRTENQPLFDGLNRAKQTVAQEVSTFVEKHKVAETASALVSKGHEGLHKAFLELNKAVVSTATSISNPRSVLPPFEEPTLCFYDQTICPGVAGLVALTIDDAPCRQADRECSLVHEVRRVLAEHEAKATFFLCTDYVAGHEEDMHMLLQDGHEVANHCGADRSYGGESEESFEKAFLESERVCDTLRHGELLPAMTIPEKVVDARESNMVAAHAPETDVAHAAGEASSSGDSSPQRAKGAFQRAEWFLGRLAGPTSKQEAGSSGSSKSTVLLPPRHGRWFRAPHADLSQAMQCVLHRYGFTNVLCDCFANDTVISDAEFIAKALLSVVTDGSIIVIHMPERGFREHNLEAIRRLLEGLRSLNLRATTVSDLNEAAWVGGIRQATDDC